MEKFVGTFELEPEKDVNMIELMDFLDTPADIREKWKNGPITRTLKDNGDGSYTLHMTSPLKSADVYTFRLNEIRDRDGPEGKHKVCFLLDGPDLCESISGALDDLTARHQRDGDYWILNLYVSDHHAKRYFKKIP